MAILITGGTGLTGAELARILVEHGENVVLFDRTIKHHRIDNIEAKLKVVQGDLGNWPEVLNVVKENRVTGIFHHGSILSLPSERNPWACFQTNVVGTMHVLEAARLFGVERVVFASTDSTYGLGTGEVVTDETLQRPTTMYGAGKLYCELLGRFYRRKFALDFRCLRYCAVVAPGVKTMAVSQYNSWMIEHAALCKPYECFVSEDVTSLIIYFKDAIRATEMLYYAPKEQIKTVCYNISGVSPAVSAKEIEMAIKKFIPDARIVYKPDPVTMGIFQGQSFKLIDDSRAREEWGWKPSYTDLENIVDEFIQEVRTRPKMYGLV